MPRLGREMPPTSAPPAHAKNPAINNRCVVMPAIELSATDALASAEVSPLRWRKRPANAILPELAGPTSCANDDATWVRVEAATGTGWATDPRNEIVANGK